MALHDKFTCGSWRYGDSRTPACRVIANLRAERDECKQAYAAIEAERDELRVLLKTLTDSVANGRIAHIGSIRAHTAQVNVQLVERCKEALR